MQEASQYVDWISVGGHTVDDQCFSTVSDLNFDMYMTFTRTKTHYPSIIIQIQHRVKCAHVQQNHNWLSERSVQEVSYNTCCKYK